MDVSRSKVTVAVIFVLALLVVGLTGAVPRVNATPMTCNSSNTPATWAALKAAFATPSAPTFICLGTLSDLTANTVQGDRLALASNGYVTFDLNGHSLVIEAPQPLAAILVPTGATLEVQDSVAGGTNQLQVTGGPSTGNGNWQNGSGAGIGGDGGGYNANAGSLGSLVIWSGRVAATGGGGGGGNSYSAGAAGIGGGGGGTGSSQAGSCGSVSVHGGVIVATGSTALAGGSASGAGIGGGGGNFGIPGGTGCNVTTHGGTIVATGGTGSHSAGAAIGGGGPGQGATPATQANISIYDDQPATAVSNSFGQGWYGAASIITHFNEAARNANTTYHNSTSSSDAAVLSITYSYLVSFVAPNGQLTSPASAWVVNDQALTQPSNPISNLGYSFDYWMVNTDAYNFANVVEGPMSLSAVWLIPAPTLAPIPAPTLAQTGLDESSLRDLFALAVLLLVAGVTITLWRRRRS